MMRWRREEKREKKRAVRLQPIRAQEPRKSVRETDRLYINCEELTIIQVDWEKTTKVFTVNLLAVLLALLLASKSKCQEHWNVAPWSTEKHICQWGRWRVLFVPCFGEAVPGNHMPLFRCPCHADTWMGSSCPAKATHRSFQELLEIWRAARPSQGPMPASHCCPKFRCNWQDQSVKLLFFFWVWAPRNVGFVIKLPDPTTSVNPCITCHLFQKARITFSFSNHCLVDVF